MDFIILIYVITTPLKLGLIWGMMWFLNRFTNKFMVVTLGLFAGIYHAQSIYRGYILCDDPQGWVDLEHLPNAINWIISARDCQPPIGGAVDAVYFYITGPLSIAAIAVFVILFVRKLEEQPTPDA